MSWFVAFLVCLVATPLLAGLAATVGWIDRREGSEERKPRTEPVATTGGAAILAGLLASTLVGGPALPWPALLAAFVLGTLDDRLHRGLSPAVKLVGQAVAAGLLVLSTPVVGWSPAATVGLAVVAMNAVNTWDNADGAAGGLALVGLGSHPLAGAALGFLPWNLARRPGRAVPFAYLGDAGSHLVGILCAFVPGAAWVLVLPLLDLGRLSVVRLARGSRPWIGDRRHLAHRLEARGLRPGTVATILALLAAAPVWGWFLGGGAGALLGSALTSVGFGLALRHTPCTGDPCSAGGRSRY